jgi:trk system potassium uptake protein TrkA
MQIIIVGCGKVGSALAAKLSNEDHNITVIDTNAERVRHLTDLYDVMGICGNGTDYQILERADIQNTDLIIAVTYSDEVNLLCCVLAKRASACRTIARVRNPIYSTGRDYIRRELGLAMTINPEHAAAREIVHLLRFPTAMGINSFSKGHIEMFRFRVPDQSPLIGCAVKDSKILQKDGLICIAERGDEIVIPDGNYVISKNDKLSVILSPKNAMAFISAVGLKTETVKNTMIVGCGEMGYYLSKMLINMGIKVKIIERDRDRCELLAEHLPKAQIICGDGSDEDLLREEGLDEMDSLVACTGIDEENIILSLYAKNKIHTKVVTKMSRLEFNDVIRSLDLDSVINPKAITTESILQYVRAMANSYDSNVETLYKIMDDRVEALEFVIHHNSAITHLPFEDLKIKKNTIIAGIYRQNKLIIPDGQSYFIPGDSVIVVTTNTGFDNIGDILENKVAL